MTGIILAFATIYFVLFLIDFFLALLGAFGVLMIIVGVIKLSEQVRTKKHNKKVAKHSRTR
jgi:uncharacterized membrane protein HdeD (DUF308 family)